MEQVWIMQGMYGQCMECMENVWDFHYQCMAHVCQNCRYVWVGYGVYVNGLDILDFEISMCMDNVCFVSSSFLNYIVMYGSCMVYLSL